MQRKVILGQSCGKINQDQQNRACFGECLQPFELGKLPPNFLKVGTKVTGALERAKDEGPLDHFAFPTCLTRDNSSSASDAMRASARLAGSTESSAIWRDKVSIWTSKSAEAGMANPWQSVFWLDRFRPDAESRPGAFLRIASIRCNLQFARHRQQTANCAEKTRRFPDQMADIQRSGKLALLSLRPWRLALVTQLLALQAPPGAKSALVCAVDGRFSANTDSNPITNNVASAQAVRLTAPRRTRSRKAFRMRGRSTMSVVFYQSKSLSRCFESVVSIVACSYILTDGRAVGALIGVGKSIVCRTRRIGDRPGAARALRNRRLEV
jgi:hypothetical protein